MNATILKIAAVTTVLAALDRTANIHDPSTIAAYDGKFYVVKGGEFKPNGSAQ